MKKNVISIDSYYLKAAVEDGVCPLNWLVKYYHKHPGKLVMIDNKLMDFLVNRSNKDKIIASEFDGYKQDFIIKWNATKEYPETKVKVCVYGKDKPEYNGKKFEFTSKCSYYVIEELVAEDILVNKMQYAENMQTDRQIIMLVSGAVKKDKSAEI